MNLEEDLRHALRSESPPAGFASRVLQRIESHFLFKLRAQGARHCTGPTGPATEISRKLRQALWPEYQQRDAEDQDDFGKADLEHGRVKRWACCPT